MSSSARTWKTKLSEWGYKKYISSHDMRWIVEKGKKRKFENKETSFFLNGTRIRKERIESFKRRRIGERPLNIGKQLTTNCLSSF